MRNTHSRSQRRRGTGSSEETGTKHLSTGHKDKNSFKVKLHFSDTHGEDSDFSVEPISPGNAQHVGQVQSEVYESATGRGQVGFGKEGADEETLHDGGSGKRRQEEKHHRRVAVRQDVAPLGEKGK